MRASRIEIDYEPRLVEETVLAALRGRRDARGFWQERDRLYEMADAESRERGFAALHGRWFERLGVERRIREVLDEHPGIAARCGRSVVARAVTDAEEAADLLVAPGGPPTLLIRLRPETLNSPESLGRALRRELLHVADMLDPRFGYAPCLPPSAAGPVHDRLLTDRYRVLWDAYVAGRLVRRGQAPPTVREERLGDFARAFAGLGEGAEAAFERFFGARELTHAELVAFARGVGDRAAARRCTLCGLPSQAFDPAPDRLPRTVLAAIGGDFPSWTPGAGVCSRCVELYSARAAALS